MQCQQAMLWQQDSPLIVTMFFLHDFTINVSDGCSIVAQAFAANSHFVVKYGFLRLNGDNVWQASWKGDDPVHRGVNIFTIDTAACTLLESRNFDTYGDRSAAGQLRDYINELSVGTVLVGISTDEPTSRLSEARSTLSLLGADVSDVGFRGAFAFVVEKGDPSETVLDKERTQSSSLARDPAITAFFAGA